MTSPRSSQEAVYDVAKCARCRKPHPRLVFRQFTRYYGDYQYWAMCPTLNEPILMRSHVLKRFYVASENCAGTVYWWIEDSMASPTARKVTDRSNDRDDILARCRFMNAAARAEPARENPEIAEDFQLTDGVLVVTIINKQSKTPRFLLASSSDIPTIKKSLKNAEAMYINALQAHE